MKNQYQNAFDWIEPAQQAVDNCLQLPKTQPASRRRFRFGALVAAAAAAVLLLSGGVWAANRWLRIRPADNITLPSHARPDSALPTETELPPKELLELDGSVDSYVGFRLPDSYRKHAVINECQLLKNQLAYERLLDQVPSGVELDNVYRRYFCSENGQIERLESSGVLPGQEKPLIHREYLTLEMLANSYGGYQNYFSRTSFELIREGSLAGMDAAWIQTRDAAGNTFYALFCRAENPACVVLICSNRSFERAEQAAQELELVSSGVPMPELPQYYTLRLRQCPEDFRFVGGVEAAEALANAVLADPAQDLSGLYQQLRIGTEQDEHGAARTLTAILVQGCQNPVYPGEIIVRRGDVGALEAWWLRNNGDLILRLYDREHAVAVQIDAFAQAEEADMESLAEALELVGIPVAQAGPAEFMPFRVG